MTDIPSLALDPIGEFLRSRHPAGASAETLEEDRVRLAEFRHSYPGLSLQRLGVPQVIEYVESLRLHGVPPAEVKLTSEVCQAFIRFAKHEPELGSGLLRLPDAVTPERENPYLLAGPPAPAPTPASAEDESRGAGVAWLIVLGFVAALAAAVYAFIL